MPEYLCFYGAVNFRFCYLDLFLVSLIGVKWLLFKIYFVSSENLFFPSTDLILVVTKTIFLYSLTNVCVSHCLPRNGWLVNVELVWFIFHMLSFICHTAGIASIFYILLMWDLFFIAWKYVYISRSFSLLLILPFIAQNFISFAQMKQKCYSFFSRIIWMLISFSYI